VALALVIFLVGLALSAFFSGSETGFYRLSPLRVAVDAGTGDRASRGLLWLTRHPDRFVATTLVGNNIANYLTTVAIGILSAAIFIDTGGVVEIGVTWAAAPVIFVAGELLPKTLYFQSPMHFLRPGTALFLLFYYIFLPVSLPLTIVSRLMERLAGNRQRPAEFVLARSRFGQYVTTGHREGLLGELQSRLLTNLLASSTDRVSSSVIPFDRLYDLEETATPAEALRHAKRFALTEIPLRREGKRASAGLAGYVRVAEVAMLRGDSILPAIRPLPQVAANRTKLSVLIELREREQVLAAVFDGERPIGVVNERGLIGQFLRDAQTARAAALAD
jgi:CBS domain containing-hemolysin-like protein